MTGGKHLLLLAGFVLLARCQQNPHVSISPSIKEFFTGDVFNLSCGNSSSGNVVWYFNTKEQALKNKIWKVDSASTQHTGFYECEINGKRSDKFNIKVQDPDYTPVASLTMVTGQPVMQTGTSVLLKIELDDVLEGWNCWDYRGGKTRKIKLRVKNDTMSLVFQPNRLNDPQAIFWCTNKTQTLRSNQIVVRTSDLKVSLEMYPLPAVFGEALRLRCLVWGTDQISKAVFYKNNLVISDSGDPFYSIVNVTESERGSYKCDATFTYPGRTKGPPYQETSEAQDVFVQASPMKADLSVNKDKLSCSCPYCPDGASYHWYYKTADNQPWGLIETTQGSKMTARASGTYACRAVWTTKRTLLSRGRFCEPSKTSILKYILIVLVILFFVALVVFYICRKKRNTPGPIYEDVALASRDKGDDNYEKLKKPRGAQKDGEYDTLNPEATGGQKREGEYEPLNKTEAKEGVYHTLGMEGAAGGEGGYEALKKEGKKEEEYHTLESKGASGGEGGYEALKKAGMKEGVYHTLGVEGAGGGEGGYEALKKAGMKEGEYHTLESKGAGGGDGGYEALKKAEMKEGVYHTLGVEGAAEKSEDKEYEAVEEKK